MSEVPLHEGFFGPTWADNLLPHPWEIDLTSSAVRCFTVDLTLIDTSQKATGNTLKRSWILFFGLYMYREMSTLPSISGDTSLIRNSPPLRTTVGP